MRFNPELEEKPNHLHYNMCLGRKTEIEKRTFEIFLYTAIAFFFLGLFSFIGLKFTIFGILPEIIFKEDTVKIAFFQIFEFIIVTAIALLGCVKNKLFNVIIMLMYILMIFIGGFFRYNGTDGIIVLIGIGGLWKSYDAIKMYYDYEQLKNTEGFPMFSHAIAENDEKISQNNSPQPLNTSYAFDQALNSLDPSSALTQTVKSTVNSYDTGTMPSINSEPVSYQDHTVKRYLPEGPKESVILESPMKFDI